VHFEGVLLPIIGIHSAISWEWFTAQGMIYRVSVPARRNSDDAGCLRALLPLQPDFADGLGKRVAKILNSGSLLRLGKIAN
jgi:hypothetical protein